MKFNINAKVQSRDGKENGQLTGGTRKCQMSGCDEDDAFVGGEKCTFVAGIRNIGK